MLTSRQWSQWHITASVHDSSPINSNLISTGITCLPQNPLLRWLKLHLNSFENFETTSLTQRNAARSRYTCSSRKHWCFQKRKEYHCGKLESCQHAENPKGLLHAVFFLKWKNSVCEVGRKTIMQLKLSQLKKFTDPIRYVYTENSCI